MHNNGPRTYGGASIIVRNKILETKINLNTKLLAIVTKTTVYSEMNVCSLYIPLDNAINKSELNKQITQLPKIFIILGDHPSTGNYYDQIMYHLLIHMDYTWKVYQDICGSDPFAIMPNEDTPHCWILKVDLERY